MAPIKQGRSQPIGGTMIPGISFIKFGSGGGNAVQKLGSSVCGFSLICTVHKRPLSATAAGLWL